MICNTIWIDKQTYNCRLISSSQRGTMAHRLHTYITQGSLDPKRIHLPLILVSLLISNPMQQLWRPLRPPRPKRLLNSDFFLLHYLFLELYRPDVLTCKGLIMFMFMSFSPAIPPPSVASQHMSEWPVRMLGWADLPQSVADLKGNWSLLLTVIHFGE